MKFQNAGDYVQELGGGSEGNSPHIYYDVKLKPVIYEIDDFVHKLNSASTKGVSKKNCFLSMMDPSL